MFTQPISGAASQPQALEQVMHAQLTTHAHQLRRTNAAAGPAWSRLVHAQLTGHTDQTRRARETAAAQSLAEGSGH